MKIKFSNDFKDTFVSIVFFILFTLTIYLIGELAISLNLATLFNLPELFKLKDKDDSNIFEIFISGFFYTVLFLFVGLGIYIIYKICVYLKNNIKIE